MADTQLLLSLLQGVPERLEGYRANPGAFTFAEADEVVAAIAEWRAIRIVAEQWHVDLGADWAKLTSVSDDLMRRLAIRPPTPPITRPPTPAKNYQLELTVLIPSRQLDILSIDNRRMITEQMERALRGLR